MAEAPETRYAQTREGTYLAYQVFGQGRIDLVFQLNSGLLVDLMWDEPAIRNFMERLASFSRVIAFDPRGFGSSGHVDPRAVPAIQTWMDDFAAVLDAAGSATAAVLASAEPGLAAILFAATYPQRVSSLSLVNTFARYSQSDDCPWGKPTQSIPAYADALRALWGTGAVTEFVMPSLVDSADTKRRWGLRERLSAAPDSVAVIRAFWESDVTEVLSAIRAPTLVISRQGNRHVPPEHSRYLASRIPDARLVELSGQDCWPYAGQSDEILDEVEEFVTGARPSAVLDRVLATVLFTDIVGSTSRVAEVGDRRWREALNSYDALARRQLDRFRGRLVQTTGDGTLAVFDGPARAVECACALRGGVRSLGLDIRAGLHTGEIETRGNDVAGIAVHIAARVSSLAGAGEVLVSRTVTDLVVGSGIEFENRGEHELKGVPGSWHLYAVAR
jgi:class 3 adenylate cyclase